MPLDEYATEDLERELLSRKEYELRNVIEATRVVFHWAKTASTADFRSVVRATGGLSVGWTQRTTGEPMATIEWANDALMKRVNGVG